MRFYFWGTGQRDGELEGRAKANLALHGYVTPHHFHQTLADSQAEAGAAITARDGAICLAEGLE